MPRHSIAFGEAHPFWDVYPDRRAYKEAGVSREDYSSISVMVDEGTGGIELNARYEPGSPEDRAERALFAEVEGDLDDLLAAEMRNGRLDDPAYDAFRERHASPSP